MKHVFGRLLRQVLPARLVTGGLLAVSNSTLLSQFGFARSLKTMRVEDSEGNPLPWMPYCLIALLTRTLNDQLDVLEFGAGHSTLFLMKRVRSVLAIEHDAGWARVLQQKAGNNARIQLTRADSPAAYLSPLASVGQAFDVIIVDGLFRRECMQLALRLVSGRGVIILDDCEREMYSDIRTAIQTAGYRSLELVGHKPVSTDLHSSLVCYRDGNCLNL